MRIALSIIVFLFSTVSGNAFVSYYNNGHVLRYNLTSPNANSNVVNPATKSIRFYIASDAYSSANRDAELNAVRASFAQWQSIPGTTLRFEDAGLLAPGIELDPNDHTNVVYWAKTTTFLSHSTVRNSISGLSGYTELSIAADNTILGSDTVLNGVEYQWFTDFNNTSSVARFVESVVSHEIGHVIGLDHSPVGAATVAQGRTGISTEAGLSSDEIAAARFLYPDPIVYATLGMIKGTVTMNGAVVFGAAVFAEDAHGNIMGGTVSRTDGSFELPALPPGNYNVRACPLDPKLATDYLRRGRDIAGDYIDANASFLPTANLPVTVNASSTSVQNIAVTSGTPFRITGLSRPTNIPDLENIERFAEQMSLGQSNYFVGVSGSLPTSDATLTVSGDGVTVGTPVFKPNRFGNGVHYIGLPISISSNATPGMRTLTVQKGSDFAYANGYLEIKPAFTDFNFDGLDDLFQRQYFPLFTVPEAAPSADPDQDGLSNTYEARTGTNPKDSTSYYLKVERVQITRSGGTVTFKSDIGKNYRIWSRPDLSPANPWQVIGTVTATNPTTDFSDHRFGQDFQFYRIELLH